MNDDDLYLYSSIFIHFLFRLSNIEPTSVSLEKFIILFNYNNQIDKYYDNLFKKLETFWCHNGRENYINY